MSGKQQVIPRCTYIIFNLYILDLKETFCLCLQGRQEPSEMKDYPLHAKGGFPQLQTHLTFFVGVYPLWLALHSSFRQEIES